MPRVSNGDKTACICQSSANCGCRARRICHLSSGFGELPDERNSPSYVSVNFISSNGQAAIAANPASVIGQHQFYHLVTRAKNGAMHSIYAQYERRQASILVRTMNRTA